MILFADGFDHYGTGAASDDNMLLGVYAQVNNFTCVTAGARTGTHCVTCSGSGTLRRVLPGGAKNNVGIGYALLLNQLPAIESLLIAQWRDISNNAVCTVTLMPTGDLRVRKGSHSGTIVSTTSGGPVTSEGYQHIEAFFTFAGEFGAVEIRRNGVTIMDISDVDIGDANIVRQIVVGSVADSGSDFNIDDMYCYDTSGDYNNVIGVGDIKLAAIYPDADTVESDWTRNTGAADYDAINDTVQDGDTTYIASTLSGDLSEFGLEDVPATAEAIRFLASYTLMKKTDAGDAGVQVGIGSANVGSPPAAAQVLGSSHTISEAYAYFMDVFEEDPATGAAFTPDAVDDARLIISRD